MKITFLKFPYMGKSVSAVVYGYNPETTEFEKLYPDTGGCFDSNNEAGDRWTYDCLSNFCAPEQIKVICELDENGNKEPVLLSDEPELPKKYAKFKAYLLELIEQYQSKRTLRGMTAISTKHKSTHIPTEMFFEQGLHKMTKADITDELVIKLRDAITDRAKEMKQS